MCDRLKLNLGSLCHFDEERLSFYRRHRGQGFGLIGISIDFARDAAKMRKVAAGLAYPAVGVRAPRSSPR
jgi:hypothetical protein